MDECAFYKGTIQAMKEVGHFVKQLYCQQNPEKCVRIKDAGDRDVSDTDYHMTPWGLECKREG